MPTKRKRQRNAQSNLPSKKSAVNATALLLSPSPDAPSSLGATGQLDSKSLATVVSEEEIEITVETLDSLAQHPTLIKSKACRGLRTAVYGFKQACTTGMNTIAETNLTSRVSAALVDGKYIDAIVLLAEMRIRNQSPKLGALCRWVRDLDVVSGLSSETPGIRTESQLELLRVMDMVLRVTGPIDEASRVPPLHSGPLSLQPIWDMGDELSRLSVRQGVLDKTIFKACAKDTKDRFRVLETIAGPERKPPNLHPAVLYLSNDNAVPLASDGPVTTFHKHPTVPDLSLMKDVLTRQECMSIVAAMETVGFLPDCPLRDDGSASSILAHNVYWVVDQAFHDALWKRVSPHIPSHVGGRKARGINRRFRVYRYVPGAEYRCHFDGGWPPSGVDPKTGAYVYDASPPSAKQSSLFTFLVYLNDEFEGGETTFFTPSIREGVMNAFPVRPTMGSVALFPHGDARGALLHEGTGVKKGAKYIIRTDVEFDVEPGNC
ncbi:putative prolyl 4-hydroxylase [Rosellinia necatrix]|uniref:Putative prolyl 4-hydroxylase n=1 Tax=Rosellinia necatrix TaxID=77044 RepID=A0A1W2TFM0_ROSNE|nr:putative prolyl 4-hydroxylase [Rosellinia necatrix]